jgi:hypothetical protein
MELNYERDIQIDESVLDLEWLDQASLAYKYGRNYADCRRRFTEAEEKVKIIRSELVKKANEDPKGTCGKDKPIAADIEAYYRSHPDHIAAKDEWVQAQYDLDMAEIAKNEIGFTRKAALENLVKLHGQQYFAGPKVAVDLHTKRERSKPVEINPQRTR